MKPIKRALRLAWESVRLAGIGVRLGAKGETIDTDYAKRVGERYMRRRAWKQGRGE